MAQKLLLSLAVVSVFATTGCGSPGSGSSESTFTAVGVMSTVVDHRKGEIGSLERDAQVFEGMGCEATDGFDDISEGGQVLVRNAGGDIIGTSSLEGGKLTFGPNVNNPEIVTARSIDLASNFFSCDFLFTVNGLPAGEDFYSVSVGNSNRGELVMTEDEIRAGIGLELR